MARRAVYLPALIAAAALLACAAALLAAPHEADAAFPGDNGRIAFVKVPDPSDSAQWNPDVYDMRPDGTDARRLTTDPSIDARPSWSPDGSELAFSSTRGTGGDRDVYVLSLADGREVNLTADSQETEDSPSWSPDDGSLTYERWQRARVNIGVMNADGTGQADLVDTPGYDSFPAWSPDGDTIAFVSDQPTIGIYAVNADGSGLRLLDSCYCSQPDWSPDGKKIVFMRDNDVWTMNADGTGKVNLTADTSANERAPAFSPDGRRVVYTKRTVDPSMTGTAKLDDNVWAMNADGTGKVNLTPNTPLSDEHDPDWQPICPCPVPPPADPIEPTITRPRPAPGAEIRDRTPTVAATARDETTDLAAADLRLYIDGAKKAFSYDPDTDRLTRTTGKLSYGRHRVRIVAEDEAGNAAAKAWSFRVVRGR